MGKLKNYFRMQAIAIALIAATATAVKTSVDQISSDVVYEQTGMYPDEIAGNASAWFNSTGKPMLEDAIIEVSENKISELETEYGVLLETCEVGMECRDLNKIETEEIIKKEWAAVMTGFVDSVENAVLRSEKIIETSYTNSVECQGECDQLMIEWTNTEIRITEIETKMNVYLTRYNELEETRIELIEECPEFADL